MSDNFLVCACGNRHFSPLFIVSTETPAIDEQLTSVTNRRVQCGACRLIYRWDNAERTWVPVDPAQQPKE